METLNMLLDAVNKEYELDGTKPGVIVSLLKNGRYYASIHRFPNGPASRQNIVKVKADTLDDAVEKLAAKWLGSLNRPDEDDPRDILRNYLGYELMEEAIEDERFDY